MTKTCLPVFPTGARGPDRRGTLPLLASTSAAPWGAPSFTSWGGRPACLSRASSVRSRTLPLVLLLLTGCAGNPNQEPAPDAAAATGDISPSTPCAPASLATLETPTLVYHSALADSPSQLRVTVRPLPDGAAGRTVTREAFTPAATSAHTIKVTGWREQTLLNADDGSLALSHEINKDDDVTVDFDPPMVVYPATLTPTLDNTPGFVQSFHVTVHPISKPGKTKVHGPGTQEITYLGDSPATLDGAPVTAVRLRSVFTSDFGGPKTRSETTQWLVAGRGVVKETRTETTRLLGVQIRDNSEAWTLPTFRLK